MQKPKCSIYVEPLGVVVMLISMEGNAGHEPKGGVEVLEHKSALDGLAALDEGPGRELGEGVGLFLGGQLLDGHFVGMWGAGGVGVS